MKLHNVVLVGFMGTGKSTIAQELAKQLGWSMVDTDQRIEALAKTTIPEIFSNKGEDFFRQLETEVIREVMSHSNQVVATGGGAVLKQENRDYMVRNSMVIALKADEETIIDRVSSDSNRPLLQGDLKQKVHQLMQQRKAVYDFAPLQIDTTNKTIDEIIQYILLQFKR